MRKSILIGLTGLCSLLLTLPVAAQEQEVSVTEGKKVTFNYTLRVDGEQVETSVGKEPLSVVLGEGQLIPGLERDLVGMKAGEKKTVTIAPADAYGEVDDQAVRDVAKTSFPEDFAGQAGMVVEFQTPDGYTVIGTIKETKEDGYLVDFNHPLAGKTLEFDVEMVTAE